MLKIYANYIFLNLLTIQAVQHVPLELSAMKLKTNPWYQVIDDNKIVFTIEGIKELGKYFRQAGVDIGSIDTVEDYLSARKEASPFFNDHLVKIARGKLGTKRTLERDALIAIAEGNHVAFERMLSKLESRDLLGLKIVK